MQGINALSANSIYSQVQTTDLLANLVS